MIGQKELRDNLSNLIESNKLPRFSILVGGHGSGKKLLAKWIATQANMSYVISELRVENIRHIIDLSYKTTMPTIYIIPNANKLSNVAQNALLKITEEPPENAYFIITIENQSQILPTLLNRGIVFTMTPYSVNEMHTYLEQTHPDKTEYYDIICETCDTFGEIDDLFAYDINEFMEYVNKVIDNIAVVNGSNAFKIANKIAIKDTDNGYDLTIFLKAFKTGCIRALRDDLGALKYADGIIITNRYLSDLGQIKGVSKGALCDAWILDIRKAWM